MKIMRERPGLAIFCKGCLTAYEVDKDDMTEVRPVEVMGFWRKFFRVFDLTYHGSYATWNCPACGREEKKPLLDLPMDWLTERRP